MPTTACLGSLSDKQCQTRRLGVIPRESLLHGYPFRPRLIADRVVTWYHREFRSSDRHLCAKSYRILYVSWCDNTDSMIGEFRSLRANAFGIFSIPAMLKQTLRMLAISWHVAIAVSFCPALLPSSCASYPTHRGGRDKVRSTNNVRWLDSEIAISTNSPRNTVLQQRGIRRCPACSHV